MGSFQAAATLLLLFTYCAIATQVLQKVYPNKTGIITFYVDRMNTPFSAQEMLIAAVLTRQAISVSKRNASIVFLADSRLIALLRPPDAPKQRKNAVSVFQGT